MYVLVIWRFGRFSSKIHTNKGGKEKSHLDYASSFTTTQSLTPWKSASSCCSLPTIVVSSNYMFDLVHDQMMLKQSIIFVIKKSMISYITIYNMTLITQLKRNRKGGQWRRMGGDVRWQCHFNENINIMIAQVEKVENV